jgi:large subunit ribosomal protein L21
LSFFLFLINFPGGKMFALNLLSESTNEPDLTWLLWLVLAIFVVIIIIGWVASKKNEKPVSVVKEEKAAAPVAPDVLKKLEGIGPKVEGVLNDAGFNTYAQLAKADVENLREILATAKLQMMDPSSWAEQAELAAKGDWDALDKLQDELQGGRHA